MRTSTLENAIAVLWTYTVMQDDDRVTDVGIVLGCHDTHVARHAATLYGAGRFPLLVTTGRASTQTRALFPEGEARRFASIAREHGVPYDRIIVEPSALNTQDNVVATRDVIAARGMTVTSATLVTRPYHARRALLTAARHWPEVSWGTATGEPNVDEYCERLSRDRVLSYLVGEIRRLVVYGERGMLDLDAAIPADVYAALDILAAHGYAGRPIP